MSKSRAEIIAIVTGFISIVICITYLFLISVLDLRSFLNDKLSNFT